MTSPLRLGLNGLPSRITLRRAVAYSNGSLDETRLPRTMVRAVAPPSRLVRSAFALFVVSIPFETVFIGLEITSISLSRLTAYLLLAAALLNPKRNFSSPPLALWLFALYGVAYALLGILYSKEHMAVFLSSGAVLVQMLVLFWLTFGLMRYEKVAMLALRVFAGGCTVLALLQLSGATRVAVKDVRRYSVLGTGPNSAGGVLALGALAVVGLVYGRARPTRSRRLLGGGAFLILGGAIAQTGSRGALVALTAGLLMLLLARGGALKKLQLILVVVFGFLALLWIASRSEGYAARWEETLQKGSMAGRERIYPAAWQMFLERPLTGWGPVNNIYELGVRTRHRPTRDTHNLLLWVMTEVGLLGTIPYCAGIWLCLRGAWRARRGSLGILPLCLVATLLIVNMGITWQGVKIHWLILALGAASARPILARLQSSTSRRSLPGGSATLVEAGVGSTRRAAR